MAISAELGVEKSVELSAGEIRYRERGDGPPVVFVHGLLVNADLWRKVVPVVSREYRCLAPDWPLGSHGVPLRPGADLSPPGLARLIAEFLEKLDLEDVTIVANDTGGGLTQILMTNWPDRLGRVVLTPSDAFELFPPPPFNTLPKMAQLPGFIWVSTRMAKIKALHRTPFMFGSVTRNPIPDEIVASYLTPAYSSAEIRRDLRAFLRGLHPRHTQAAAAALPDFHKPVLLVWAKEEKLFKGIGQRLAGVLPDARLVEVPDSYTFVPEDQPDTLAELIMEFVGARREPADTA
jgi:pimeloyl-ACP methyl ester carboxylesterase